MSNDKENFSLIVPIKMLENLFSFCFWKEIDLTLSGFIDWEKINLNDKKTEIPIGVSCRTCDRLDCSQRAFPPLHKKFDVDIDTRGVSVYVKTDKWIKNKLNDRYKLVFLDQTFHFQHVNVRDASEQTQVILNLKVFLNYI